MKNVCLIFFIFVTTIFSKEVIIDSIVFNNIDGLFYEKGSKEPFSGLAIKKNEDGNISILWEYKDGKNHGIGKNFYENGNIKFYGEFENGVPHGTIKEYDIKGVIFLEENFKNGILDGEKKEFYDNGNIKNLETYKDGFLNGTRISYDENGNIKVKEIYDYDEVIESEIWPEKK